MKWLLMIAVGVVLAAVILAGLLRPTDPWVGLARAERRVMSLPSQIWAARRAGNVAREQQLIGRYNDLADQYNAQARQAMLEYGAPDTEITLQFSHWIVTLPDDCDVGQWNHGTTAIAF